MITFLGVYRGAAVYEYDGTDSAEGQKQGSKVVAKAMTSDLDNLNVVFVEEGDTTDMARDMIKRTIDHYLENNHLEHFVRDIF